MSVLTWSLSPYRLFPVDGLSKLLCLRRLPSGLLLLLLQWRCLGKTG